MTTYAKNTVSKIVRKLNGWLEAPERIRWMCIWAPSLSSWVNLSILLKLPQLHGLFSKKGSFSACYMPGTLSRVGDTEMNKRHTVPVLTELTVW